METKPHLLGELVVARDVGSIDAHNNVTDRHLVAKLAAHTCQHYFVKQHHYLAAQVAWATMNKTLDYNIIAE
jgi:hypothetical protein